MCDNDSIHNDPVKRGRLGDDKADRKWPLWRRRARAFMQLLQQCDDPEVRKHTRQIFRCAVRLVFVAHVSGDKKRLLWAYFCRFRWCPVCLWRRMLKWHSRLLKKVPEVAEQHPDAIWVLLTLTLRNCKPGWTRQTLQEMSTAWRKMHGRKFMRPVYGWVRALEVTFNHDEGTVHPHYHVLICAPRGWYVDQKDWRKNWQKALGVKYEPFVDIRMVKGDPVSVVPEVVKYCVKPEDMLRDTAMITQVVRQMKGTRAIATSGVLKIKETDIDNDLADDIEANYQGELFGFQWDGTREYEPSKVDEGERLLLMEKRKNWGGDD